MGGASQDPAGKHGPGTNWQKGRSVDQRGKQKQKNNEGDDFNSLKARTGAVLKVGKIGPVGGDKPHSPSVARDRNATGGFRDPGGG